jgi:hypothetical protein
MVAQHTSLQVDFQVCEVVSVTENVEIRPVSTHPIPSGTWWLVEFFSQNDQPQDGSPKMWRFGTKHDVRAGIFHVNIMRYLYYQSDGVSLEGMTC